VHEVLHTPGAAPDHIFVEPLEERVLFTGDTVLDGMFSVINPSRGGDMAVYVETLERLEKMRLSRLCPGHGDVIDEPKARIREYIEHRRAREEQIYKLVKKQPAKIPDLVAAIYTGDDLPPELIEAAAWQVQAHLVKLKKAGRVTGSGAKSVWAAT